MKDNEPEDPDDDDGGAPRIEIPFATHWPSIKAAEVEDEWSSLWTWTEHLLERFPQLDHHVIPPCWWRHNSHVEALVALRDHERASFSVTAPATAPTEWFRVLRDITTLLRAWTSELGCGMAHQQQIDLRRDDTEGWKDHMSRDIARRAAIEAKRRNEAKKAG